MAKEKKQIQKIFKSYKAETKSVDIENHIVEALISTASVDRDSEIINPDAFTKSIPTYMQHAVLLSSHNYYAGLTSQIGAAISVTVDKDGVKARFKYFVGEGNDEADWAFNLASKGMAAYSVGFMPKKWEDKTPTADNLARRVYTEIELVEVSQVLIPSNRGALENYQNQAEGIEKELCELVLKSSDFTTPESYELKSSDKESFRKMLYDILTENESELAVLLKPKTDAKESKTENDLKEKVFKILSENISELAGMLEADKKSYIDEVLSAAGGSQSKSLTKPEVGIDKVALRELIIKTIKEVK